MNRVPPIDAIEHVGELRGRDSNNAVGRRWPDETTLLQPFGIERHADAVMPKNLDQIAPDASEHVEIARVRIATEELPGPAEQARSCRAACRFVRLPAKVVRQTGPELSPLQSFDELGKHNNIDAGIDDHTPLVR